MAGKEMAKSDDDVRGAAKIFREVFKNWAGENEDRLGLVEELDDIAYRIGAEIASSWSKSS